MQVFNMQVFPHRIPGGFACICCYLVSGPILWSSHQFRVEYIAGAASTIQTRRPRFVAIYQIDVVRDLVGLSGNNSMDVMWWCSGTLHITHIPRPVRLTATGAAGL